MRLTDEQILSILNTKGLTCENLAQYKNLDSPLSLKCKQGHPLQASLKQVKNINFRCPYCAGKESISSSLNLIAPPSIKFGYRVVAIDNATEKVGMSVFDDGKLVYYTWIHFSGESIDRMVQNRQMIENIVIKQFEPDFVVVEDIQYQDNIQTFKKLAMLLGSTVVTLAAHKIPYDIVLSKVWRSHFQIAGRTRQEQKKAAIEKVKNMYGLEVNDDQAEAILLGKYQVDKNKTKKLF